MFLLLPFHVVLPSPFTDAILDAVRIHVACQLGEKMEQRVRVRHQCFTVSEQLVQTSNLLNPCSAFLSSVALALGALTLWHAVLISRGETSIERHINKKERRRLQAKGRVSGMVGVG